MQHSKSRGENPTTSDEGSDEGGSESDVEASSGESEGTPATVVVVSDGDRVPPGAEALLDLEAPTPKETSDTPTPRLTSTTPETTTGAKKSDDVSKHKSSGRTKGKGKRRPRKGKRQKPVDQVLEQVNQVNIIIKLIF